jgi:hypothetical protein
LGTIVEPQRHTIGAHRQEGIYVDFDSPSIIRYVNLLTGVLFCACFVNCRFEEDTFPSLKGGIGFQQNSMGLTFKAQKTFILNSDLQTSLAKTKVTKMLHL